MFLRKPAEPVKDRWLVVGLGNPEGEYAGTRHNLGFGVVDELAGRQRVQVRDRAARSLTGRVRAEGREVVLAKPQTYMNLSGTAVKALRAKYGVPLEHTVIVHDELDLPFGRIRVRLDGSAAGHNGVESVIESLGTRDFIRVRIGVGRPIGPGMEYLLSPFTASEREALPPIIARAADAVLSIVQLGLDRTMTDFNRS